MFELEWTWWLYVILVLNVVSVWLISRDLKRQNWATVAQLVFHSVSAVLGLILAVFSLWAWLYCMTLLVVAGYYLLRFTAQQQTDL